jgi:hypothetical protein
MKARSTAELKAFLDREKVPYSLHKETGSAKGDNHRKRRQLQAVKRWFHHDWRRIDTKLRTNIVEGISVFLSLFDDNPTVKDIFYPPKELYSPDANPDGQLGKPFPIFADLIEQGRVVALNFPTSANPGLAMVIGTMMKQDFQRAMLNRIPQMTKHRTATSAKCSSSATSTNPSLPSEPATPPATRSSSPSRAKPSASPSSPRKASVRSAPRCLANPGARFCKPSVPRSS